MSSRGSRKKEEDKLSSTAVRYCRRFSLADIRSATRDFNVGYLIGEGGFGKVYKAQIDDGKQTVAMKRLAPNSNQGEGEFLTEIETLSKLRHINLVSLIGYCNENGEMILVYEYIARGTLADHLYRLSRSSESDDCSSLTWKQRLNICIGAGRGIDYLHTGSSIIHRDVKSTNILLGENFTAKVSDFGLAKHLITSNSRSHVSTVVKGSFGYLDPSYFTTCRLTRKSDTYAFGVVLLEVLCGRPAVDPRLGEDEMSLVMWARERISKGKAYLRDEISADCLKTFVGIAKRCVNNDPKKRPTMAQVVAQLEFALEQQDKKVTSLNTSRFLHFLNWVIPSGSRPTGSIRKEAIPAIPIQELKDITNNFSYDCLIGWKYGVNVYRGDLKSGQVAAIKLVHCSRQPDEEFLAQVAVASSLKHENVAKILGYCVDGRRQLLAYEFAENGCLHNILHGDAIISSHIIWADLGIRVVSTGQDVNSLKPVPVLLWGQRVKIAVGAAKGLEYIHEKEQIHCNIRSSNVLVYDANVVKLAYFRHATQSIFYDVEDYDEYHSYHPPEYTQNGHLSWRTDVYGFGVVLLELLTGDKRVDNIPYERDNKGNWVKDFMDAKLNGDYPVEAAAKMAAIAVSCLKYDAASRPDMSYVVRALTPLLNGRSVLYGNTKFTISFHLNIYDIFPSPETSKH